jgi:hypothetical protein
MPKFYGDIMRDFSENYKRGFFGGYPAIIKVKTDPTERISLGQSYRFKRVVSTSTEGAETVSYVPSSVVTLKAACHDKQMSTKVKVSNDAAVYELGYKPKDLNTADKSVNVKHNSKLELGTQNVLSTESVKVGAKLFSDVHGALAADYVWSTASGADQVIKASLNFTKKEINFGVKSDYSLNGKKAKSLLAQASYNTAKVDHFLTFDAFTNHLTYATLSNKNYKANEIHACDVVIDTTQKLKGFFGYPLTSSWAGIYTLSDVTTLRYKLGLAKDWTFGFSWGQKVNSNLSLNFSQDLNVSQVLGGKANSPYNFGLQFRFHF